MASDINSIIPEIVSITNDIKNSFSGFISVARIILGVGAMIWICVKTMKVIATGEADGIATHFSAFTKPFLLMLLLVFYSPLLSLCDFLIEPVGKSTEGWAMSYMDSNSAMEVKYKKDLEAIITGNANTEASKIKTEDPTSKSMFDVSDLYDSTTTFFSSMLNYIKLIFSTSYWIGMIVGILNTIINFCLQVAYLSVLVMRAINLSILIAFGPIAIAISVFHPFGDNWKAFFANYINKLLWFPVANMVLAIAYRLKNISDQNCYDVLIKFAKNTNWLLNTSLGPGGMINSVQDLFVTINAIDWTPVFLSIGVTIIGIFAVAKTASFANLIISGATGGMIDSPLSGASLVGGAALATVGGGKILNTVVQALSKLSEKAPSGGKNDNNSNGTGSSGASGGAAISPNKIFGAPTPSVIVNKPKSSIEV